MATVVDLLQQLAHDLAPDEDILRGPLKLPPRQISPFALDLPNSLGTHWTGAFGRPTTSQHALATAATRAGEAVAFVGGDTLPAEDLLLLVLAQLRARHATALWLVPNRAAAKRAATVIDRLAGRVSMQWLVLKDAPARPPFVQLIVATYDELHTRLLPFADRAWHWFWNDLRAIAMSDLERTNGLPGAHLRWLLRRAGRLSAYKPVLLGASAPLGEGGVAFQSLWGRACRIVDSTVGPAEATLVMLWRCKDRYAELDQLANKLRSRGLSVAVVGRNERDDQVLRMRFDAKNVAALDGGARAAIALVSGVPAVGSREALLRSGYRLVVMLAGDDPHEIVYANDVEYLVTNPPTVVIADENPFVANYHLQFAAAELPLEPAEIEHWRAAERVEGLVNKQRLRLLTDGALHPSDAANAAGSTLQAATSNDIWVDVRDPLGSILTSLRPAVADWRGLPGSTWSGDLVVAHRSDDPPTIDLAVDERRRVARAVTTYTITPRTKLTTRTCLVAEQTINLTHWNAEIRQRVTGLEEHTVDRPPVTPSIARPLEARWVAHACSIELPAAPPMRNGAGWSLKEALLMRTYCAAEDVVVTYDIPTRSLWLIETAPGGTGVAAWIVAHVEELLVLARVLVRGCAANDLLRTLALGEQAWLETLLDPAAASVALSSPSPVTARRPEPLPTVSSPRVPEPKVVASVPAVAIAAKAASAARSRVYAASRSTSSPSTGHLPVAEEAAVYSVVLPHDREETEARIAPSSTQETFAEVPGGFDAPQSVLAEQDIPLVAQDDVDDRVLSEAATVVEDQAIPGNDEIVNATPDDGRHSRVYAAIDPEVDDGRHSRVYAAIELEADDEGKSRIYDAFEPEPSSVPLVANPDVAAHATPAQVDNKASQIDYDDVEIGTGDLLWEEADPSEVPFAASPPAPSPTTDEAEWRMDGSTQAAEIEDIGWATDDPTDDIEDVTWEPNSPAQLPLETPVRDVPSLGRELPALNAPRSSRFDRERKPAPSRRTERPAQAPPTSARDTPSARPIPPRNAADMTDRVTPASTPPPNERRPDNRREQERRSQPDAGERRGPQRPERPPPSGRTAPDSPKRAPNVERPPNSAGRLPASPNPAPPELQEAEESVNVGSMIARMRRLREERERTQKQGPSTPSVPQSTEDVALRFRPGQHVRCVPYGEGVVQSSRVHENREQILVKFPEIGTLEVDAEINFVRVINAPPTSQSSDDD